MELRKKLVGVAALAFATALSAGVAVSAGAEEANKSDVNFKISGVSVRFDDPAKDDDGSGIRFKVDTPDSWTKETVEDAYTMITLAPKTGAYAGTTTSAKVSAQVWRDETGWNTVLVNIPEADYTTDVTAQAFVVFGGEVYETESVSYSLAEAASIAMNNKNALDDRLTGYVVGVESVSLDKETLAMKEGEKTKLTATIAPADYKVVWSSDNTDVATVDKDGNVTAKKVGSANITASMGGKEATCAVTVGYNTLYDFEDGKNTGVFYINEGNIGVGKYNDSNALAMYLGSGSYIQFFLSADYLAWAFEDKYVKAVSFDVTIVCDPLTTGGSRDNQVQLVARSNKTKTINVWFTIGETQTMTITRAQYESDPGFADLRWNNADSNRRALTWYVDNLTVQSYSDYDFEDGKDPGVWTLARDATDAMVSVVEYNGSKMLQFYDATGGSLPAMHLSAEYLAWAFADATVQSVSFDVTVEWAEAGKTTITLVKQLASAKGIRHGGNLGEPRTITITREEYETFAADTTNKAGICEFRWDNGETTSALTWYVDNLQRNYQA